MLFNNGIASIELAYILDDINTASEAASNIITEYETCDPDTTVISENVDLLNDLYESYGIKDINNNDMDYLLAYIMCKNPDCYSDIEKRYNETIHTGISINSDISVPIYGFNPLEYRMMYKAYAVLTTLPADKTLQQSFLAHYKSVYSQAANDIDAWKRRMAVCTSPSVNNLVCLIYCHISENNTLSGCDPDEVVLYSNIMKLHIRFYMALSALGAIDFAESLMNEKKEKLRKSKCIRYADSILLETGTAMRCIEDDSITDCSELGDIVSTDEISKEAAKELLRRLAVISTSYNKLLEDYSQLLRSVNTLEPSYAGAELSSPVSRHLRIAL